MPDRTDEILNRLAGVERALANQQIAFAHLDGSLGERCLDHQRQLNSIQQQVTDTKRRLPNGNGASAGAGSLATNGLGIKAVIALAAAVVLLVNLLQDLVRYVIGK